MESLYRKIPVVKRLYPSLMKQWAGLTWIGGYKIKKRYGLNLLLNYNNHVDRRIALNDGYENEQFSYFFSHISKGCDVFLDIGACFGIYALRVAKLGAAKEIHAFEPDPRNFAQMQTEIYLNNFTGVIKAHEMAMSDKDGSIQFELATDNKTGHSKVSTEVNASAKLVTVPCKTLDTFLSYTGKKIFIKMDVEDHELACLHGATQTLKNNDCFLQVEVKTNSNEGSVVEFMATQGYKNINHINDDYYFVKK